MVSEVVLTLEKRGKKREQGTNELERLNRQVEGGNEGGER